ncbi:MAG: HDOD domain-containing protein [Pseudomonadota bacterium]
MSAAPELIDFSQDELAFLRNCSPLKHFDKDAFRTAILRAEVRDLPPNTILYEGRQKDNIGYYLLSGQVKIYDKSDQCFEISGGGIETLYPITMHVEARVKCVASTNARFAAVSMDDLADIEVQSKAFDLHEIDEQDDKLDERILVDVFHAIQSDQLVLPSLPEVATKIRSAAEDDDVSVDMIAKVVQTDPATSAYCISVANSAAYAGASEVAEVREAVVRMGISGTRDVVTAYTLRSLFQTENIHAQRHLQLAWSHSCVIAANSFVIAKRLGSLNAERALLAGLIHEVGTTMLIATALKLEGSLNFDADFRFIAKELSGPIGAMILRAWNFPDSVVDVVLDPENYDREPSEKPSLADIVMLAHYQDDNPVPWSETKPSPETILAIPYLDDALDDEMRLRIVSDANEEYEAVLGTLRA